MRVSLVYIEAVKNGPIPVVRAAVATFDEVLPALDSLLLRHPDIHSWRLSAHSVRSRYSIRASRWFKICA